MVPEEDGKRMVALAHSSVESRFSGKRPADTFLQAKYSEKQGVFVTLTKDGRLRGCIGYPEPILPLYEAIIDAAKSAAFNDPRFPPVREDELDSIRFEVSVLTVPKKLEVENPDDYLKRIRIGTDGLIIRGLSSGLLLPQVATEWKFDAKRFLEAVSEKAGLPRNAWRDPENKLFTFQAQIFGKGQ